MVTTATTAASRKATKPLRAPTMRARKGNTAASVRKGFSIRPKATHSMTKPTRRSSQPTIELVDCALATSAAAVLLPDSTR
ncbi:MAG: hypothetical protein OMOMHJEC_01969 [Xanthomonadales bacterium]|nr:hypothetical protein [Xanthomonadales bacterium]